MPRTLGSNELEIALVAGSRGFSSTLAAPTQCNSSAQRKAAALFGVQASATVHIKRGCRGARMYIVMRTAVKALVLLTTGYAFLTSPLWSAAKLAISYSNPNLIAQYRLERLDTQQYEMKIREAIADGDFNDAADICDIATEQGHAIAPDLVSLAHPNQAVLALSHSKEFARGFATGEVTGAASIMGAIAADYSVVGDLRDIAREGGKAVRGDEYDVLVLGLSLIGAVTLAPGTGAVDVSVSILKTVKRSGKLSAGLANDLIRAAGDLVDVNVLRTAMADTSEAFYRQANVVKLSKILSGVRWSDLRKLDLDVFRTVAVNNAPRGRPDVREKFANVLRPKPLAKVAGFTGETAAIVRAGGMSTAFRSLEHAAELADLNRFQALARATGDRTSSIIRILGKRAIHLGELIYAVLAAALYVVVWLLSAFWAALTSLSAIRTVFR